MTTAAFYGFTHEIGAFAQRRFDLTNWQRLGVEIGSLVVGASLLHKRYRSHFIEAGMISIAKAIYFTELGSIVHLLPSSSKPQLR